jgi:hypothetical protein
MPPHTCNLNNLFPMCLLFMGYSVVEYSSLARVPMVVSAESHNIPLLSTGTQFDIGITPHHMLSFLGVWGDAASTMVPHKCITMAMVHHNLC